MPARLLPPDTLIHSRAVIPLRWEPGHPAGLVPATPFSYPQNFLKATDSVLYALGLSQDKRELQEYGNEWPVEVSPEGLKWDPRWNVFQAFHTGMGNNPNFLTLIRDGKVDWRLRCASLEGPETLIGQCMQCFCKYNGCTPGEHYPQTKGQPSHRGLALKDLIGNTSDAELVEFRDRSLTLLDLAMQYQQWEFAEHLWGRGVRPSDAALANGKFLEPLIMASHAIQESEHYGMIPNYQRSDWLSRWLSRHDELGACLPQQAQLDWRGRDCQECQRAGADLRDTPQSLWIAYFLNPYAPNSWPRPDQVGFKTKLIERWVDFWTDHGVDLEQVEIRKAPESEFYTPPPAMGLSDFHNCNDVVPWGDLIRQRQEVRRLQIDTPAARGRRLGARL